jgi:hypothetical protein
MKTLISAAVAATILVAPALSFAQQSQQPVTRAQVKAELAALEHAGYRPVSSPTYPQDLQAAQARIAQNEATAYGGVAAGSSQAGAAETAQQPVTRAETKAELADLEKVGYRPVSSPTYPQDLRAAEARLADQAYGASSNGSTQAGSK